MKCQYEEMLFKNQYNYDIIALCMVSSISTIENNLLWYIRTLLYLIISEFTSFSMELTVPSTS